MARRFNVRTGVPHQKVDVVGCRHVVEHAQTEPLLGFENPMQIPATIARIFQRMIFEPGRVERLERSAAIERLERLKRSFRDTDAFYAILRCQIKKLRWSDPASKHDCYASKTRNF